WFCLLLGSLFPSDTKLLFFKAFFLFQQFSAAAFQTFPFFVLLRFYRFPVAGEGTEKDAGTAHWIRRNRFWFGKGSRTGSRFRCPFFSRMFLNRTFRNRNGLYRCFWFSCWSSFRNRLNVRMEGKDIFFLWFCRFCRFCRGRFERDRKSV